MITNLVGTRIRSIRAKRNLTQQQLADQAKIPRATLASVEQDDANPSLAVVHKISLALDVTIDQLIVEQHQRVQAILHNKMPNTESGDGNYSATTISPSDTGYFLQLKFHLKAGANYEGKPHPPGSEEFLHILQGEVTLEVAGESVRLVEGDSARFGGNVHHVYSNHGQEDAIGLVSILEHKG